jgi:putative membrane protein
MVPAHPMQTTAPLEIAGLKALSTARALLLTFAVSAAVVGFLFWLLYFRTGSASPPAESLRQLPALNAALNGMSSVFLVGGFVAVRRGQYRRHMRFMLAALATSTLFFASYVTYHHYFGSTRFTGAGPIRSVYFFILLTHVVLAVVVVPLILLSFFTSLSGRLTIHRRVSRFTFPIWLYVSVTGVLVFAMLKLFSK